MFSPEIDRRSAHGVSVTQYGVQPPNSRTALIVTDNRAEAECALELITDGRVVHRTIIYGDWLIGGDNGETDLAG